jgi:divalent metal cation (Fe/Co/Zn/Cd) transporter
MENNPIPSPPRDDRGRPALLRRALRLEGITIVYNVLEGVIALVAGWMAGSIALVGFGFDSTIETLSAVVVFLRLYEEHRGHDADAHVMTEKRTEQFVGGTLFALCLYILYQSTATLIEGRAPEESTVGIVLAAVSLVLMPMVAAAKRRTGTALGSRALMADATETLICAYLSFTLLLGLGLNALFGWWWADPVAALVMIPFIFHEAREAWRGED